MHGLQARVAGTTSLVSLAQSRPINKVKIAAEPACLPALLHQMQSAEVQLKLAGRMEALVTRLEEAPLLALLDSVLGKAGLRSLSKLAQQVSHRDRTYC